jgi:hypothetical protein
LSKKVAGPFENTGWRLFDIEKLDPEIFFHDGDNVDEVSYCVDKCIPQYVRHSDSQTLFYL